LVTELPETMGVRESLGRLLLCCHHDLRPIQPQRFPRSQLPQLSQRPTSEHVTPPAEVEGVAVVEGANSWGEPRRSAGLPGRAESAGEAGASVSATVLVPPWIRLSPPQLSFSLAQHSDQHRPKHPVLLAVDQQLDFIGFCRSAQSWPISRAVRTRLGLRRP
jgi:hypothetical protein